MKKRSFFSFLSKKKKQTTSGVDQTEEYFQQLIAMGYSKETARAYATQHAAQPTAATAAVHHAQQNAIQTTQSHNTPTTAYSSTRTKHKTSASQLPAKSCRKCNDNIQEVLSGDELCGFCKKWPEISPTRMRKYNTVIRWVGLNNRKESMVKATIIHRLDILEEDAQRICEAPVFRSLMGWNSAQ